MAEPLYKLVAQQALRIAELEAQVAVLKQSENDDSRKDIDLTSNKLPRGSSDADLDSAYTRLLAKHHQLEIQHSQCEHQLARANHRYKRARDKVMEWHAYVKQQSNKKRCYDTVEHHHAVPPGNVEVTKARSIAPPTAFTSSGVRDSELPITPLSVLRTDAMAVNDEDDITLLPDVPKSSPGHPATSRPAVQFGSSQSTIPEPESIDERIKNEPHEDDVADISVTEVRAKRRRVQGGGLARIKLEPGTSQQPVQVYSDDVKGSTSTGDSDGSNKLLDLCNARQAVDATADAPKAGSRSKLLRAMPLESMRLEHFMPNPNFRGAHLKMIDPNVRRPERRCPPRCKKPECCGNKLRKMVELGGVQVTSRSDQEVLEEYLGPKWREMMASYNPERRKDIVLQAHTVSFVGTAQKRRSNHDRPTTPPGFWRIDMPTTQEYNDDQAEAQEIERRIIEERWHEARRANGQWLFRDEA